MVKGLHKLFKAAVNKLNNSLPILGESGSELSHVIPEHMNFTKVARLPADFKKSWLKATLK